MEQEECKMLHVGYECFEQAIDMVAGKWKMRILFMLAVYEVLRYNELKRHLTPITHKMLSSQLKELERDGLVERREYPQVPPKVEYTLTEKGQALRPSVEALQQWMMTYSTKWHAYQK